MKTISRWSGSALVAATAFIVAPGHAEAQEDWDGRNVSVEARIGSTFPVGDLADLGGESGLAVTADLLYNFTPNWSAYGGWGFHDFNCDGCPDDLGSSGPHFGGKYLFDWDGDALPWARAGLLLGKASAFQGGAHVVSTRSGGLELGTGIDLRVAERLSITPSAWFNYYSAEMPVDDIDMSYFLLDVGAHYHF